MTPIDPPRPARQGGRSPQPLYRVENLDHRTAGTFVTYGAGHRPILHRSFSLRRVLGMSTAIARGETCKHRLASKWEPIEEGKD